MIVFVSSVVTGFKEFREAAVAGARLVAEQVLRFEDFPASPDPSRKACLDGVGRADIVVLIMGERYGTPQPSSGLSPTHEEFREAIRLGKPVLAFLQRGVSPEPDQVEFVTKVQGDLDWGEGQLVPRFSDPADLKDLVTKSLVSQLTGSTSARVDLAVLGDRAEQLAQGAGEEAKAHVVVALAGDGSRGLLRPAQLVNDAFADELIEGARMEGHRIFSVRAACGVNSDRSKLTISQEQACLTVTSTGDIRVALLAYPPGSRNSWRGMQIIREDVHERVINAMKAAAWMLDKIDPTRVVPTVGVAAAFLGGGYSSWVSRAVYQANQEGSSTMYALDSEVVQPSPPAVPRARLIAVAAGLADDLIALIDQKQAR